MNVIITFHQIELDTPLAYIVGTVLISDCCDFHRAPLLYSSIFFSHSLLILIIFKNQTPKPLSIILYNGSRLMFGLDPPLTETQPKVFPKIPTLILTIKTNKKSQENEAWRIQFNDQLNMKVQDINKIVMKFNEMYMNLYNQRWSGQSDGNIFILVLIMHQVQNNTKGLNLLSFGSIQSGNVPLMNRPNSASECSKTSRLNDYTTSLDTLLDLTSTTMMTCLSLKNLPARADAEIHSRCCRGWNMCSRCRKIGKKIKKLQNFPLQTEKIGVVDATPGHLLGPPLMSVQ